MAGGVRVGVAFNDTTLEPAPTWVYITDYSSLVASFEIDRGRSFEMDQTDAGRASVTINDHDGILDPTNPTGPYYGLIEPLLQICLDLYNPVAATWTTIYRGYIEEYDYVIHPAQRVAALTISCIDAFGILAAIEMQPDPGRAFGDPPPAGSGSAGDIFFEDCDQPYLRMMQVLGNANWPPALTAFLTGNVVLQETYYSPGESVLTVLQEAADAEFPGIGNLYVQKDGKIAFHGRKAKFDPVGTSVRANEPGPILWNFQQWIAGDASGITARPAETAQLRSFSYNRGLSKIINFASASPAGIKDSDLPGQTVENTASIAKYGYRPWSKPNLLTAHSWLTGNEGNDETKLFAAYYAANYGEPRERITDISFRSMFPDESRAENIWALLCGVEISDLVYVTVALPGGGGIDNEAYFIEGLHYEVKPLQPTYADVTLTLDLSPKAYYPTTTWPFDIQYATETDSAVALTHS